MAHEGSPTGILRLSGTPECLGGVIELAELRGDDSLWEMTLGAYEWLICGAYRPYSGTVFNWYLATEHRSAP
jgi:hypothetical protein